MLQRYRYLALVLAASLTSACALLRQAEVPLGSEFYHHDAANSTLVVLLHGRGGEADNFVRYGAVDEIRSCNPGVNILGVDSHFGYYRDRIIEQRLREDIIRPARENGTREVWILGISMGGLGGLVYRQRNPDDIEAVILMAPYLGDWDELEVYLEKPAAEHGELDQDFVEIWNRLGASANRHPDLTLAYGEGDSFNNQHRWLAGLLGDQRVVSGPGGHNWKAWQPLIPEVLQRSGLCATS